MKRTVGLWIAAAVGLVATVVVVVAGFALFAAQLFGALSGMQGVPFGVATSLDLEPGTHTLYYEAAGGATVPSDLACTVTDPAGDDVGTYPLVMSQSYELSGVEGRAWRTFEVASAGRHVVACQSTASVGRVTVGSGFTSALLVGMGGMWLGILGGVVLGILTGALFLLALVRTLLQPKGPDG